jgi:hypothetical protein
LSEPIAATAPFWRKNDVRGPVRLLACQSAPEVIYEGNARLSVVRHQLGCKVLML